jgi:hypothetical protein
MSNEFDTAIADRIILAYVNISVWTGAKRDKALAQETSRRKGASDDACSVTKYIVDKQMIDYVNSKAQAIRVFHYKNTVAWDDNNARALPVSKYFEYEADLAPLIEEFNMACRQFAEWYADNWNNQQQRLGDMFDATEYPYPQDIQDKFRIKVSFRPVQAMDFRTELPDVIRETVKESLQQGLNDGVKMATIECWRRIAECMGKVYCSLEEEKKIFRDSLIENVQVLADTLQPLNIGGDKILSDTICEMKEQIGDAFPDLLRVDPVARRRTAEVARKIFDLASLHSES